MKSGRWRHFLAIVVLAGYLLLHVSMCFQSCRTWAARVASGQGYSRGAHGHLIFAVFEMLNVRFTADFWWNLIKGSISDQRMADAVLVLSMFIPCFQILMAMNYPSFLAVEKNWAAFHAFVTGINVLAGAIPPGHTLVQMLIQVPAFA